MIDEAIAAPDIAVGICSAATKEGFLKVVNSIVGPDRLSRLDVVMAGDDVTKKKPDPLIYNLAREKVGLPASKCVVIEDSLVGLRAAMGANMPCVITPCPSSDVPDFRAHGARAVMDVNVGLGDGAGAVVTLAKLFPPNATEPDFDFGGGYGSSGYGSSGGVGSSGAGSYSVSAAPRASPAAPTAWCTIPISSTRTRTSDRGERRRCEPAIEVREVSGERRARGVRLERAVMSGV